MSEHDIMAVYPHPCDVLRPIAIALQAAQFIVLDPNGGDLAADLIAWAQETADRAADAQHTPTGGDHA